jgi:PKD domain-containing protein
MRRFDAPCALSRLARAGLCLGALLGPLAGVAQAAQPNDEPSGAIAIPVDWTNKSLQLAASESVANWSSATGLADVQPSCTGAASSDHSQWWSVTVAEAGTLKLVVSTASAAGFTPVVTLYDANNAEVGCATTESSIKVSPTLVTLNAYVFPLNEATAQTYLVRVADVVVTQQQTPRAPYDLYVQGHDLTPPRVVVTMPKDRTQLKRTVTYHADQTKDVESDVDTTSGVWTFNDGFGGPVTVPGMTAAHTWKTPGLHTVAFSVKDNAGNGTTYAFFVFVHDWTPPRIRSFTIKKVPFPGDRFLTVVTAHDEPVTMHLTITQGRKLLYRGNMRLLDSTKATPRTIHLRVKVRRTPWIDITGSAKDSAGNVTILPGCHLDPVGGGGHCFLP